MHVLEDFPLAPLPSSLWGLPISSLAPHSICKRFLTFHESEQTPYLVITVFWFCISANKNVYNFRIINL